MLSSEAVIDRALVERVVSAGHSRVPVYEAENKQVHYRHLLPAEGCLAHDCWL